MRQDLKYRLNLTLGQHFGTRCLKPQLLVRGQTISLQYVVSHCFLRRHEYNFFYLTLKLGASWSLHFWSVL